MRYKWFCLAALAAMLCVAAVTLAAGFARPAARSASQARCTEADCCPECVACCALDGGCPECEECCEAMGCAPCCSAGTDAIPSQTCNVLAGCTSANCSTGSCSK